METVGKKVVKLDYTKGYCAQFSTAICVICGSILKIPLSTTHCMVGGLFGIIIANKMEFVQRAYGKTPKSSTSGGKKGDGIGDTPEISDDGTAVEQEDESDESKKANKETVMKILAWWIATLPVALGAAALLTKLCLINSPG